MSKVLFLDIDGTLVDYQNRLPESAVAAIRKTRTAGNVVFLCSGRAKAEVSADLWAIGIDGYIGGNGNYVEYGDEVLLSNAISPEDLRRLVEWFDARDLKFYLECNSGLFASPGFAEAAAPAMRRYMANKGQPPPDGEDLGFHGMVFDGQLDRDDAMKVSYVLHSYEDHLEARLAFPNLQHGVWGGRGAEALFGDVGVEGITKAVAIGAVLDRLAATADDAIAFGDAAVDLPMFAACGFAVAMGNASPDVLQAADLVTDDVEADGLAHAFASLGLVPS